MMLSIACWMRCSLSASTWLVASSRTRIGVARRIARAMLMRCVSAGKLAAHFTEDGVVSAGFFEDEVVGESALGGRFDVEPRGVRHAIGDVLRDRAGEDHGFLRDDADLAAKRAKRGLANVHAVDQDSALLRIVETRQKRQQSRLARTISADDRDRAALGDMQADISAGEAALA